MTGKGGPKLATCRCGLSDNDGRTRDSRGRYIRPCARTVTQEDFLCDGCRTGCCTLYIFGEVTFHAEIGPTDLQLPGGTAMLWGRTTEFHIMPIGTELP